MVPFSLNWRRDADGYRIENFERYGKSVVRNGGELLPCQPIAENEMLYAEFAGVKTPEQLLEFVNNYGLLDHSADAIGGQRFKGEFSKDWGPADDGYEGELVADHLDSARLIRDVLDAENRGNTSSRRRAYQALAQRYDERGEELGHLRVVPQVDHSRFQAVFEASSLMNAIWLQLARRIGSGVQWEQCRWCGSFFEKGPGTDKRKDMLFCNPSHKVAYHRKQRRGD